MENLAHRRHDISDRALELLKPHLPGRRGAWGRPAKNNRQFINAVIWILRTGGICRWRDNGIWEKLFNLFVQDPDFEWLMIDASYIKVHAHGMGAAGGITKSEMKHKKFAAGIIFSVFILTLTASASFAWEYIGHAEAVRVVSIRPEISAKISKIHFNEGSFVKESEILFTLNAAEFYAETSLKKAELSSAQAKLENAEKYLARLNATDKRGVSASDIDAAEAEVKQTRAAVDEAKAALKIAQIQSGKAKITAPFAGKIGKINFYKGSYVSPEESLCEITELNPMRILFAMPDRDYFEFRNPEKNFKFELILSDGSLFSGSVEKDFEDSSMNPETGTMNIWLKAENENNVLVPGSLVRVKVTEIK